MATNTTPTYTDAVSIIAAAVLARGSTARGTIDLRGKHGAWVFAKLGRGGTTALTNGVNFLARRVLNNDVAMAGGAHPYQFDLLSQTAAASATTVGADSAAAQNELKLASVAGLAVGELLCVQDSGGGVTRLEWVRVSKLTVASGTGVTLDRPLQFTHTLAQADTVRSKADVFAPFWIDGGSLWECIFDYGDDAAGESVTVHCAAQTLDSLATA